jgi:hypothetical protein
MPTGDLGFVGAVPVSKGAVRNFIEKQYFIPARATASADAETVLDKMLKGSGAGADPVHIDQIEVIPSGDITGNGTNYVTLKVYNRKGDGTGTDVIASLALSVSGTYGKYVPLQLTLDASKAAPKLNDVLTFSIEHAGTGQTTPTMAVRTRIRA